MKLTEQVCGWLGTSDLKPFPINNGAETSEIKTRKSQSLNIYLEAFGFAALSYLFFFNYTSRSKNKHFQIPIRRHM